MVHPPNAEYVSDDGLVSYDAYGRRLDSNGNVAYGGGGGGGGGDMFEQLPEPYRLAFASVFGPIKDYYTPQRGGAEQASVDYQSLSNAWAGAAGQPLAPEMYSSIFGNYGRYVRNNNFKPDMPSFLGYVNANMLTRPPTMPPVSFLKVGEV